MITIKVDEQTLKIIEQDYSGFIESRNIGYILFVIKTDKNIITAFNNKKGVTFKVTVQGDNAVSIAQKYSKSILLVSKKEKQAKESPFYINVDQQIGSDEVGTGDLLGPMVVCAAYCDHETMKLINDYEIKDSKKLTDDKILEIVPLLLKKIHYEYKVLSNERYNDAIKKGFNMVKVKCVLHNFVLTRLHERCPYVHNIYVDQFTPKDNYYAYLAGIGNVTENIVFKEKGETYFPSVALGSCIARYYFLIEMQYLSKKYQMKFPYGAGEKVDDFSKIFIKKYGFEEFAKIAKQNFRNFEDLAKEKLL